VVSEFPDDDEEEEEEPPEPYVTSLEVHVTDPELLGTLYAPNGDVIAVLYDRRVVPFGFQLP
jgi:hypothetical protein